MNTRPAWAEVELSAISHNLQEIRRITQPQARIMTVVKANAYGHGAVAVSKEALANGASYLGVALFSEALELREAGIDAPILILGYNDERFIPGAVEKDITQTVFSIETAKLISEAALRLDKKAKIHLKIDTGMARIGFKPDDRAVEEIEEIAKMQGVEIEGIFTHFAVSDIEDKSFTLLQKNRFIDFCGKLEKRGTNIPIKHAANSAAIIDLPETHLDMVRLGISLYGLYPSTEVNKSKVSLRPALAVKANISHLKDVPGDTSVSYGRKYFTKGNSKIATVPLGYADGYTRLLSSKAEVLIRGERAPVAGRICMDQFMVDVGHIPGVKVGDEVVLIGKQGTNEISADDLADILGTINYEIVCMLSDRLPRVYKIG